MQHVSTVLILAAILAASTKSFAQPQLTLKEGDEVQLRFAETISSKTVVSEDPVNLALA